MIPPRRVPIIDTVLNCLFTAKSIFFARPKFGPLNLRESRSPLSLIVKYFFEFSKFKNTGQGWNNLVELNEISSTLGSGNLYPRGLWARFCANAVCSSFHALTVHLVDTGKMKALDMPSLTTPHLIYLSLPRNTRDSLFPKITKLQQDLVPYASGANLSRTSLNFHRSELEGVNSYWMRFFDSWKRHVSSVECQVPIDANTVLAVMAQCRIRSTRQTMFDKYMEISNPTDKTKIILELLKVRKAMATNLGRKSWSDLEAHLLGVEDHQTLEKELVGMWKFLIPAVKETMKRMDPLLNFSKNELGPLTESINYFDELFLLEKVKPVSGQEIWENLAATPENVLRIFQLTGKLFGVTFDPVVTSWLTQGWSSKSLIFKCSDNTSTLGYVYVNLWRNGKGSAIAGATPLCTGHVKLSLELHKGGVLDKHFFSGDVVSLMMHEIAHAIHHLVNPGNFFNQQPLDFIELPSVYAETFGRTTAAIREILPRAKNDEIDAAGKHVFWFLKLLQNVAVYQTIHSSSLNLEKVTVQELANFSRAVAQKFWPTKLPANYDALQEPAMWMTSIGQSRIAYLRNYFRAYSLCDLPAGSVADILKIPGEPGYHARVLAGETPPHPLRNLTQRESRIGEKLKM